MSIATVVTRGYGSFGSIAYVVRAGYDTSAVVDQPMRSCLEITQGLRTAATLEQGPRTTLTVGEARC